MQAIKSMQSGKTLQVVNKDVSKEFDNKGAVILSSLWQDMAGPVCCIVFMKPASSILPRKKKKKATFYSK